MNPLTNMKNVKKLSEAELKGRNKTSWHDQYRGSAWIFVGGLPYDLTEGDIVCVFSQFGEPVNINLVRDKDTGKSKGFCFICYEDQRSTDLAVDNLNGTKLLGRSLRVDHVNDYKPPKERKDDDETTKVLKREGLAAATIKREIEDVKPTIKKEKDTTHSRKIKIEKSDSEPEVKRHKNSKKKKSHKKKKESSSSESESSDSESEEERIKKKKKRKQEPSSSESSSEDEPRKKRHKQKPKPVIPKTKTSKSIEDLKREAQLIQEELERRQVAKGREVQRTDTKSEKRHKGHAKREEVAKDHGRDRVKEDRVEAHEEHHRKDSRTRARSPRHRSRSPRKSSSSPRSRDKFNRKHTRSPHKQSHSPKRHSPKRRSRSPRDRRHRSPPHRKR